MLQLLNSLVSNTQVEDLHFPCLAPQMTKQLCD